jgi:inorganic triphosphatase YgiF
MEVELQFLYRGRGPLLVPIRLADLELRRSNATVLLDTYFDTESLELRRAGCSLRIRQSEAEDRPRLTFKGPSRKRNDVKRRHETEVEIGLSPANDSELRTLLRDLDLDRAVRRFAGLDDEAALHPIGQIRNRRSQHRYAHGLHRLDLTWDELEFPTGPEQTRLEVEAQGEGAERLLEQAAKELTGLFADDLVAPDRGKTRELCERLYPELLAA